MRSGCLFDIDLERLSVEGLEDDKPQKFEHVDFMLEEDKSLPELVKALLGKESRPHMRRFLKSRGFAMK